MSVQRFKDATKDTDAILEPPGAYGFLQQELKAAGYGWLENERMEAYEPPPEQREVGGWDRYWRGPFVLELFHPHGIFDKLSFSPAMKARTVAWFESGLLRVRLADASTMFLLKAVTGRWRNEPNRDVEDLQTFLDKGAVDMAWIEEEWQRQLGTMRHGHDARAVASEAVQTLEERGYRLSWKP